MGEKLSDFLLQLLIKANDIFMRESDYDKPIKMFLNLSSLKYFLFDESFLLTAGLSTKISMRTTLLIKHKLSK